MMTQQLSSTASTDRLLICGVAAGPLFIVVWFLQAVTRSGFDITRHPVSLLSLGELGWIQITGFVITGLLYIALAVGLRQVLGAGPGQRSGPALIAANGVGLVIAGVFLSDAGAGFPPGAPPGAPEMSWHGMLHEVGFAITQLAWVATCLVFARRYAASGQKKRTRVCIASLVAVVLVLAIPHLDSLGLRLVLATAMEFGFLALLALYHLPASRTDPSSPPLSR